MSIALRILLVAGAVLAFAFVAQRIRKSTVLMGDAIFWVALSGLLIVLAVFPEITFFFSDLFGFVSPSNFIFLFIIVLLMAKMFANSSEISLLKHRVNELAQENALLERSLRDRMGELEQKK
ncbi:DUF2304 domain-containing protein [Collinsella tanakaei]|uniref:DUF2304 domain-containing protein n=1 Tax=Collinsella tanakaei TaxID=626935 RepID=UPI00195A82DA|nr:DUF2304 domain-containing protein [Collinsella tanakaei]MBM6779097.1 DUF2304 domain-containing protein [Collinsella tanakaei]